jgi:hypothetical protein
MDSSDGERGLLLSKVLRGERALAEAAKAVNDARVGLWRIMRDDETEYQLVYDQLTVDITSEGAVEQPVGVSGDTDIVNETGEDVLIKRGTNFPPIVWPGTLAVILSPQQAGSIKKIGSPPMLKTEIVRYQRWEPPVLSGNVFLPPLLLREEFPNEDAVAENEPWPSEIRVYPHADGFCLKPT